MNSEPNSNWEDKIKEIETEINQSPAKKNISNWFSNLSAPAKVVVTVAVVFLTFTILNIFLKVVTSILSIVVLAGILYVIYRFLIASDSQ